MLLILYYVLMFVNIRIPYLYMICYLIASCLYVYLHICAFVYHLLVCLYICLLVRFNVLTSVRLQVCIYVIKLLFHSKRLYLYVCSV